MAETFSGDVVIIGSGVAGALVANELAQAGIKVLVLEAGPRIERATIVSNFYADPFKAPETCYPNPDHAQRPTVTALKDYYVQEGPDDFASTYERVVGGTTWHWLGTSLRLLPNDFKTKTTYGVGDDWPITYEELAPWYDKAEAAMGVAGDAAVDLGAPRTGDYPLPLIPVSYADTIVAEALSATDMQVATTPQARNSIVYDNRPSCCGNHICIPVCPIQAKYDATVHVAKAEQAGAQIVENAVVYAIDVDNAGNITQARFKRPDQSEGVATGKIFVLAAHAIEGPKILLMSQTDALPNGVANSSGMVGRHLMDHPIQLSWCVTADPIYGYRGPLSTSGIENLRDGSFRATRSAFRIEMHNDGWEFPGRQPYQSIADYTRQGIRGEELRSILSARGERDFALASLNEQLPNPDNRIEPAFDRLDPVGIPRPRIYYQVDQYTRDGMVEATKRHDQVFDALGATFRQHGQSFYGAGHIMGTTRMGSDPKTSVVDKEQRSWDHKNLFVLGSSTFVTTGTANPTLTLAALALWAADTIKAQAATA
jgi:choline dehydrogenase-like flavoprotein